MCFEKLYHALFDRKYEKDETPTPSDPQPWQDGDFEGDTPEKWRIIEGEK